MIIPQKRLRILSTIFLTPFYFLYLHIAQNNFKTQPPHIKSSVSTQSNPVNWLKRKEILALDSSTAEITVPAYSTQMFITPSGCKYAGGRPLRRQGYSSYNDRVGSSQCKTFGVLKNNGIIERKHTIVFVFLFLFFCFLFFCFVFLLRIFSSL